MINGEVVSRLFNPGESVRGWHDDKFKAVKATKRAIKHPKTDPLDVVEKDTDGDSSGDS